MSQFWAIYKKVDFWTKNQQKWPKSVKREFSKKWRLGQPVYTLQYPISVCEISKKSNEPIYSNIQKSWFFPTALPTFAPFCPFWGQIGIFPWKWQIILKHLMVFYLHAKKYKKRLNGSKDIVIWKIEQSDWSRAFAHKSRELEFS